MQTLRPASGDPARSNRQRAFIRWFKDIRLADVPLVGGKTASLGELHALSGRGILVPDGFALTAEAYRDALSNAQAWDKLHGLLDGLDKTQVKLLQKAGAGARAIVYDATGTLELRRAIEAAYSALEAEYGVNIAVAVRSSATAEDLPTASFAGQHESFLSVRGGRAVVEACRRCFASLFTDRAISYRIDNGFDHFKVALSVGVMKMVRSDEAASGVAFTLDTESGFRDVVFITGAYGLGENVVQGTVDPDEFYVHKPTFRDGYRAVLSRTLGGKQKRMVYTGTAGPPVTAATTRDDAGGARTLLHRRRRRARTRPSCDHHRTALFTGQRCSNADGHRMGQGWSGRRHLHRPGAAGDGRVAARGAGVRDLHPQGSRRGAGKGPRRRRKDRRWKGARHQQRGG
jgi:hypothetical protein